MIKFQSLPYKPLRITSGYGDRSEQVKGIPGATAWHDGVDIGRDKSKYPVGDGPCGNVFAVMDGIVIDKGYNKARGYYLILRHAEENGRRIETLYQHLYSEGLPLKTVVKAGQIIARMGKSGVGNATHLHFELRVNGKPIDPTNHLKAIDKESIREQARNEKKPIQYDKNQIAVKKKFRFSDATMKFLISYKHQGDLMIAWLQDPPRPISKMTKQFILKYESGKAALERVYGGDGNDSGKGK